MAQGYPNGGAAQPRAFPLAGRTDSGYVRAQTENIRGDRTMTASLKDVAEALVAHCRAGTEAEGLATLYAPDAVSVEAMAMPGGAREARGVDAIRAKHAWWFETFEVTEAHVEGPFLHGEDRFAVIFSASTVETATGKADSMREVGVYTVSGGRIVREEFFSTA